jgi:toxin ParE1/3/4
MSFSVLLTDDAVCDLYDLHEYIARKDAPQKAEYVLNQIEKAFSSLAVYPDRGVYPKELLALGIREYREIFFKPYRIIYRVMDQCVYILLVVDGRRDFTTLLHRRMLGG